MDGPAEARICQCKPITVGSLRLRSAARVPRSNIGPVVFELMPDEFTLYELQKTVEAILGPHLHKQNFRRLVEGGRSRRTDG